MFSFFKRSKSKDDSDKKDKNAKDKSTHSPFIKRNDAAKVGNSSKQPQTVPVIENISQFKPCDFSFPVKVDKTTEAVTPKTTQTHTENGHTENVSKIGQTDTSNLKCNGLEFNNNTFENKKELLHEHNAKPFLSREEFFKNSAAVSPVCTSTERTAVGVSAGNNSDHYESRNNLFNFSTDESVNCDSKEGSKCKSEEDETPAETEVVFKTAPNTPVLAKHLTLSVSRDSIFIDDDSFCESFTNKDSSENDPPEAAHPPLGLDFDLPNADSESDDDTASTVLENPELIEKTAEQESETLEKEETTASKVERSKSAELPPYPGELYDIAEESTSEDEEDEDSDSVPVPSESKMTFPATIEEHLPEDITKKNMVNQEAKFQEQVGDMAAQLEARENESKQLLYQIDELRRDVDAKTGGMDRLQAELISAHKESEIVRKKLRKLEEDLDTVKQKNSDLTDEVLKKAGDSSDNNYIRIMELEDKIKEMADKIKYLESQLQTIKEERDKLQLESTEMKNEREEERKIVQEALDEALTEKETIQRRFEQDFEKLRTVNTDREQQLLDDFEWKLREVEQMCKKRLEEKERTAKQRIKEVEDKLAAAEKDLSRVETLKQYEAEAIQLRGVNFEQEKALKVASKTSEQLQTSEKTLTEEVQRLKTLLEREKKNLTTVQGIHNREIAEKDRKLLFKLEQQKNELNSEWEEKLRKESVRIKSEVEKQHRDEKRQSLDKFKEEKEEEIRLAKLKWMTKQQDILKELEVLKERLIEQGHKHQKEVADAQTSSDRDIFDLRRKLDKIDITYQEEIEKMQDKHEKEIARLTEEHEKKLQQCEQNWQLQIGTTRTTLELVKEQLQREAQDKLQAMSEQHRRQLEEQWEQLVQERDETVAELEQRHRDNTEKLQAELDTIYKARNSRENELLDTLMKLRQELSGKSNVISELQNTVDSLQGGVQVLNQEVITQKEQVIRVRQDSEIKLREKEAELEDVRKKQLADVQEKYQKECNKWKTIAEQMQQKLEAMNKQLEENKQNNNDVKLVNDLRRALNEKEQQVAQLSKEKHLYQLELMNRGAVTANQRRKGSKGQPQPNKSGNQQATKGGGKHK